MNTAATDKYAALGFGAARIGFGERPAVAVVDFQAGFTDPRFPLGGSAQVAAAVERTVELLAAARAARAPVIHCYTVFCGPQDAPHWKIPSVVELFRHGHPSTALDARVFDRDYDIVVQKTGPSLFFQTPAISALVKQRVDTVIVAGCNTSGCVRATIVDAFSFGFRVAVPHECCGDVEDGPHWDNLRDVGRRYADVVTLPETIAYLDEMRRRNVG